MNNQHIEIVPLFLQHYILKLTIPIFLLFFFVFQNNTIIYFFLFYYLLAISLHFYVSYIEKNIKVSDSKKTVRLFPKETGTLSIIMQNNARLPIMNGKITFRTSKLPLINEHILFNSDSPLYNYSKVETVSNTIFTFSFVQNAASMQQWDFSFQATKRGCFQIENLECIIGDPFQFIHIHLPSIHKLRAEILVYPSLKPVIGLQQIFQTTPGTYKTTLSFHQDESTIIGIKPYERESFRSIHWKASVKMQQLHAKQYQPVLNHSWSICLCLSYDAIPDWNIHMEDLISYTAFICQTAVEKKIPFELFISVLSENNPIHLPTNEGIQQYTQTLEKLARITQGNVLLPKKRFIHYFMNKRDYSSSLIFIGVNKTDIPSTQQPTYFVSDKGVVE